MWARVLEMPPVAYLNYKKIIRLLVCLITFTGLHQFRDCWLVIVAVENVSPVVLVFGFFGGAGMNGANLRVQSSLAVLVIGLIRLLFDYAV